MNKKEVIKILKVYRNIDNDIVFAQNQVKNIEEEYYVASGSSNIDGMPKAVNTISKPTERLAFNRPDYISEELEFWQNRIKKLIFLKSQITDEINKLNITEKNIIFDFYVLHKQWVYISEHVKYSERQCRNLRDKALDDLGILFKNNKNIEYSQHS